MSTITITINMDNAAFADDTYNELTHVLNQVADKAINAKVPLGNIRDTNGNTCGKYEVSNA
ncbi:hypothetical protein EKK58_09225 [Candidatus Dependentiae bacterium]|nr:MAG: hypothetical protein EKK58_09225 [Candidatus Dependentiae bacterium]